jgi:hypothetical protein
MVYIITPYNDLIIQGKRVYKFTIKVDVTLFRKCNIYIYLLSSEKKCFAVYEMTIEGEEYLNWEGDDSYILSYVNAYLQNVARTPPSSTVTSKDSFESDEDDEGTIYL